MTTVDVLVVGGGPSGLAAAASRAESGASVMLVDEWPNLGGHLRYRPDAGDVGALVEGARRAGVDLRAGTVAWGAFAGRAGLEVGLRGSRGDEVVSPRRLVLATGTTDRMAPIPGGTLPGVMTVRALLILINVHGVRPGRRFAVVGVDDQDVRAAIGRAGGEIVGVVSERDAGRVRIVGGTEVEGVEVGGERVAADVVVMALGTEPDTQLLRMLGEGMAGVEVVGSAKAPASPSPLPVGGGRTSACLCRCEGVSVEAVEGAIGEGNRTVNDVKRRTRAGMGLCQGIFCVGAIAGRLVEAGVHAGAIEPMTARPPVRLTTVGDIAAG